MEALERFLHMGGYAPYVWSAYAVALVMLVANLVAPMLRARSLMRRLERLARLEGEQP